MKEVRLTLPKALALANLKRAQQGQKAITMNALASKIGVATTTITRLARTDEKGASSFPLDLAGKIVSVLHCGIEDLLEVVDDRITDANKFSFSNYSFCQVLNCCPSIQILFLA